MSNSYDSVKHPFYSHPNNTFQTQKVHNSSSRCYLTSLKKKHSIHGSSYVMDLKSFVLIKILFALQVRLTIRTLPELPSNAKYRCVFGSADPIDASVTSFGLQCPTPEVSKRPSIPEGKDHVNVALSVRSSETNKDFVSRNFAFYDCSAHNKCSSCVQSQWACNWCVYENKCTHNASACQSTIISGVNVSSNSQEYFIFLYPILPSHFFLNLPQ